MSHDLPLSEDHFTSQIDPTKNNREALRNKIISRMLLSSFLFNLNPYFKEGMEENFASCKKVSILREKGMKRDRKNYDN